MIACMGDLTATFLALQARHVSLPLRITAALILCSSDSWCVLFARGGLSVNESECCGDPVDDETWLGLLVSLRSAIAVSLPESALVDTFVFLLLRSEAEMGTAWLTSSCGLDAALVRGLFPNKPGIVRDDETFVVSSLVGDL